MNDRMKVSVAMATYNGEKYIKKQLDSILQQLNADDEIVISDDGSTDKTIDIIKSYKDNRIILINGPKDGINKNFENAIKHTKNDYIFLSDQDDIWNDNKVNVVLGYFKKDDSLLLIRHNGNIIDDNDKVIIDDIFKYKKISQKKSKGLNTFIHNNYQGCSITFKKSLVNEIIPIPKKLEYYDWWIGLIAIINGNVLFINDKLFKYRRYIGNNSHFYKRNSMLRVIKNRFYCLVNLIKYRRSRKRGLYE